MEYHFEAGKTLGILLRRKELTLVTAESCTGGWLAKVITDVPGASSWFQGGIIAYSNLAKQRLLGISAGLLFQYGAVSKETAEAMVKGVLVHLSADVALSITGIAGPSGGLPAKPVGTVCFGFGYRKENEIITLSTQQHFLGNRELIRLHSVSFSIQWGIKQINKLL